MSARTSQGLPMAKRMIRSTMSVLLRLGFEKVCLDQVAVARGVPISCCKAIQDLYSITGPASQLDLPGLEALSHLDEHDWLTLQFLKSRRHDRDRHLRVADNDVSGHELTGDPMSVLVLHDRTGNDALTIRFTPRCHVVDLDLGARILIGAADQ